jgi:short-subunit dehydrogenase
MACGTGTVVNVAGMIAFADPAPVNPQQLGAGRVVYTETPAHTVAMTQSLHAELTGTGVAAHVVCPGLVATEFH